MYHGVRCPVRATACFDVGARGRLTVSWGGRIACGVARACRRRRCGWLPGCDAGQAVLPLRAHARHNPRLVPLAAPLAAAVPHPALLGHRLPASARTDVDGARQQEGGTRGGGGDGGGGDWSHRHVSAAAARKAGESAHQRAAAEEQEAPSPSWPPAAPQRRLRDALATQLVATHLRTELSSFLVPACCFCACFFHYRGERQEKLTGQAAAERAGGQAGGKHGMTSHDCQH